MRLLIVEDDAMIGERLQQSLRKSGHAVDWLTDGASAEAALESNVYELLLLDIGLPNRSGIDVLRHLRREKNAIPVIVITARDSVQDRITGLDSGADDYLVKPFSFDELEARIRAVERRHRGAPSSLIEFGRLTCDPVRREVRYGSETVNLSGREYQVLSLMLRRPGAIVSRAEIEDHLYSWNKEVDSNSVEVHVHFLRKKIDPKIIRTVRGLGYQLVSL